jgi:molybdenum cofactor cytidylyltransferase
MIAAIILAAGLSQRMGQAKMLLPWGDTTVIGQVVETVLAGGIEKIVVVTGGNQAQIEAALRAKRAELAERVQPVDFVFNLNYADGEMLKSLQVGLKSLDPSAEAALMVLGDQPQMQAATLRLVCAAFRRTGARLVIPSYQLRRGHPWLIERSLWPDILKLPAPATLRDFLKAFEESIFYQVVDTPTILKDLDTPEDYAREKPA